MSDFILHHYDFSPYAEKIRLVLGLKGLAWRSVIIPSIMPKPDLVALTGGYRNTPVMQIGADVYCDTRRIAREIDRRVPSPPLLPPHTAGLAQAIEAWAERDLFNPIARYVSGVNAEKLPAELHLDRAALFGKNTPSVEKVMALARRSLPAIRAQLPRVEDMLSDGRPYLLGAAPGLADLSVYHGLWFFSALPISCADELDPFAATRAWMDRIAALGHGTSQDLSAKDALAIAERSQPAPIDSAAVVDDDGLMGARISIRPDGYQTPEVVGEVVFVARDEVSVRRADCPLGDVNVHFPRIGYTLRRL